MNRIIQLISFSIILFSLSGCNNDETLEEIVDDRFIINVEALNPTISGLIKYDEIIEISFDLSKQGKDFSYLEVYWEYEHGSRVLTEQQPSIDISDFELEFGSLKYLYSIRESTLYETFLSSLSEIETNSEFRLLWYAYDSNNELIESNEEEKVVITVQCEVPETYLVGKYLLTSTENDQIYLGSPYIFDQDTINITIGENPMERELNVVFYDIEIVLRITLGCNGIMVPQGINSGGSFMCGDNTVAFNSSDATPIDFTDDSEVSFNFIVDYNDSCGLIDEEVVTLVKLD